MAKTNYNQPLNPREIETIKNASRYVVSVALGRGQFRKEKLELITDAVAVARGLAEQLNKTVMLYAVMDDPQTQMERSALICNFYPDGTFSVRADK